MKKTISLVLVLVMLLSSLPAFGENFTLRNGISFGMSKADVMACESIKPSRDVQQKNQHSFITYSPIEVVGLKNSSVEYGFDDNRLTSVYMTLEGTSSNSGTVKKQYDQVQRALIEKYGPPLDNNGVNLYYGSALELLQTLENTPLLSMIYKTFERSYDEWLFEDENGLVKSLCQ